uniref:Glycoside hydrolase 35 catalytic domain-containing protein n=1 Tax=Pseudonaja textilis TaxID=8673 RepID=A0A670YPW6_PSETE
MQFKASLERAGKTSNVLCILGWLLQDPEMQLRTTYKGFTEAVDSYFDNLMPQVVHLQYKNGGPIIAMQVENEYGSYAQDQNYMAYIKQALLSRNVVELLVTSDNKDGLNAGIVEGVNTYSPTSSEVMFSHGVFSLFQHDMPTMVMEYWTGWFDSWGEPHNLLFLSAEMLERVEGVLRAGASINLYMFHGGTNFGFMNGAVHFNDYKATITSYDYDAVLTEAGDYTAKYFKLRKLFSSMIETPLPPPPIISHKASYGAILMQQYISLWELLSGMEIVKSEYPINMENLPINNGNGQAFGYTLYETVILGGGTLYSRDYIRDRAQVFVNTRYIGHLDYNVQELPIPNRQGYRQLQILVENSGRVNYGLNLNNQRKGLIGDIVFNKTSLRNFKIYSLEMKPRASPWSAIPDSAVGPAFFRGTLQVQYVPQDTFLKLEGWEKGVVFVNGQNLGRYWKIGPQETLYLPGTWLQQGYNEIVIFEERLGGRIIHSTDLAFLGRVQYVT